MLWRKRCKTRWFSPVAGFLVAVLILQLAHDFVAPNLFSTLVPTAEAAVTKIIRPNGDGSQAVATAVTCAIGTDANCVDEVVTTLDTPTTLTDYLLHNRGDQNIFLMDDSITDADTVTSITVWMYQTSGASNFNFDVNLLDSAETALATVQTMAYSASPGWTSLTFSGLSLTQSDLTGLRITTTCVRTGGGSATCTDYALYAEVTYDPVINLTVGTLGSQQNVDAGVTNQYLGGAFSIVGDVGTWAVATVTVEELGSVDAQADLANVKLFYELDTNTPYDCAEHSYAGTEAQFGSTLTGGFTLPNGDATFYHSGGVQASSTQAICLYPVVDVLSSAGAAQTIEVQITNPDTDVKAAGSPVISPATAVAIAGQTVVQKTVLKQENFIWRNDDGSESAATAAAAENAVYLTMSKNVTKRLRVAVFNDGNKTSAASQFRLEYAPKSSTCALSTGWTNVGDAGGDFDPYTTAFYSDGDSSTDIAAITNPDTTHQNTNSGLRSTGSQTGDITLSSTQFVELEFALRASTTVSDGNPYCFRVTNAGTEILYTNYPEATISADLYVTTSGTQTANVDIPSTDNYAGGDFIITDVSAGMDTLSSITITGAGTVDLVNDIANVQLRYDYDTSNPYTCDDQSYAVTDAVYGSATTFNGSGKATFSGTATTTPTQTICLYVEYDVGAGATNGETVLLSIADPATEISAGGASISPQTPVSISGSTQLANPITEQAGFHWRNNDGDELGATSATGGENIGYADFPKSAIKRLRFSVANTGLAAAPEARYRLEWHQKVTTCDVPTGWEQVDTLSDAWEMGPTGNLTQDADTTDVAVVDGGVSDPAGSFLINNNGVATDNDITASSTLPADTYLDVEYSVRATLSAVQGATYCFRVTANGAPLDTYTNYAEATIKLDTDFKVQRGVVTATSTAVVIRAGTDYEAPASASSSFIRITNTQLTGAGPNTGNGNSNADDVTIYITNPDNLLNNIIFQRAAAPVGNTRISWEIVEYTGVASGENEIIVRNNAVLTYGTAATTVSSPAITSVVTDADVVPFITSQYNPDAGRNSFNLGLSTSAWNAGTGQVDMTRSGTGNAAVVTYSLVEFTGSNWKIQRAEHTYTNASTTETEVIASVNSLARSFLHVQKRTAQTNHADFGHEVWLSSIGLVSFKIDAAATTPANHTSVAWVIENTQTQGQKMVVTRSVGTLPSSGAGPEANNIPIGKTLDDLGVTSLFVNNRSDDAARSWPEPILGARLISTTQYELWRSDGTANIQFQTEVVEWPTAVRKLVQNDFWIYADNDSLTPSDPWPPGGANLGENSPMTADDSPMKLADIARIRMTLSVSASTMPAGLDSFRLKFAKMQTTCTAVTTWYDVGEIGSTTAAWRGANLTPADGTALSNDPPTGGDLLLTLATVAGTYEEQNPSALNPYLALPDDEVEYDWVVQHNGADDKSSYCFRMEEADGTPLTDYNAYPTLRTVGYEPLLTNWRWYDDETSLTPSADLALENFAPIDIANQNAIKLRLVLREASGADGINVKFAVQFSEYADFSQAVATVTATSTCLADSLWCYFDGTGVDNQQVDAAVISDAGSCVAGVGDGCGTHNEGTSTVGATFDQTKFTSAEYEFTLLQAGARANAVYYFRLYDVVNDEVVGLDGGASYPSLLVEGPQLVSTMSGLPAGTTVAGVTADVATTPVSIGFGSVPFNTSYAAIQRLTINTSATEGYQLMMYATQQLTNSFGDIIPGVTGTNAVPTGWSTGCSAAATGCFGYHTTDATLEGSSRFAPIDSYAAVETVPREIMYSSIPANDVQDVVYRILASEQQPAGDYQTSIVYVVVPSF